MDCQYWLIWEIFVSEILQNNLWTYRRQPPLLECFDNTTLCQKYEYCIFCRKNEQQKEQDLHYFVVDWIRSFQFVDLLLYYFSRMFELSLSQKRMLWLCHWLVTEKKGNFSCSFDSSVPRGPPQHSAIFYNLCPVSLEWLNKKKRLRYKFKVENSLQRIIIRFPKIPDIL